MIGEATPLAIVTGLLAVQVVVAALAARYQGALPGGASADVDDPEEWVDDGRVECPECRAENERGYRFCRNCVSELPAAASFERSGSNPLTRGTL